MFQFLVSLLENSFGLKRKVIAFIYLFRGYNKANHTRDWNVDCLREVRPIGTKEGTHPRSEKCRDNSECAFSSIPVYLFISPRMSSSIHPSIHKWLDGWICTDTNVYKYLNRQVLVDFDELDPIVGKWY